MAIRSSSNQQTAAWKEGLSKNALERLQEITNMVHESKNLSEEMKQSAIQVLCEDEDLELPDDFESSSSSSSSSYYGDMPQLRRLSMDSNETPPPQLRSHHSRTISGASSASSFVDIDLDNLSDKELMKQIKKLEKETSMMSNNETTTAIQKSKMKQINNNNVSPPTPTTLRRMAPPARPIIIKKEFAQHSEKVLPKEMLVQNDAIRRAMERQKSKQGIISSFIQEWLI